MKAVSRFKLYITAFILCVSAVFWVMCAPSVYAEEQNVSEEPITVTITANGKNFVYNDTKIVPSDFTVAEQIENRRINEPLNKKLELIDVYLSHGADYKTALDVCFPLLKRTVAQAADYLYICPVDAQVKATGGKVTVISEKPGRILNENKLYAGIYCVLKYSGGGNVKAYTDRVEPKVTEAELRKELYLRGTYTTDFSGSTADRAHNVRLAVKKTDGAVIPPGETMSFNGTVGPRTASNGFKTAKIIIDGKYTDGIGGGVCQASTAVYNASLVAGLHCAANAHSICPSYCPAGLDAMISSASDLLITNTTTHNIYITSKTAGGKATVYVYGEKPEFTVTTESVITETVPYETVEQTDDDGKYFDADAIKGDRLLVSPGKEGCKSETYLVYSKNGTVHSRVKIRENEYRSLPRIIAVAP